MPKGQPDVDVEASNVHPQPDDPPGDGPREPGQLDTVPQEVKEEFSMALNQLLIQVPSFFVLIGRGCISNLFFYLHLIQSVISVGL
jgi:hypothetical protein